MSVYRVATFLVAAFAGLVLALGLLGGRSW